MTSSKANLKRLRAVAARQNGCFTAAQALQAGYADSLHPYHLRAGDWIRVYRGVYRLASCPLTAAAACSAALLWSRGKSSRVLATLHPETAERLAQNPSAPPFAPIRLVVPKTFRRSAATPDGIELVFTDSPKPESTTPSKGNPMENQTARQSASFEDPYFLSVPRSLTRPAAPLGGLPSFLSPSVPGYAFPKQPEAAAPAADRYDWADFRAFFE